MVKGRSSTLPSARSPDFSHYAAAYHSTGRTLRKTDRDLKMEKLNIWQAATKKSQAAIWNQTSLGELCTVLVLLCTVLVSTNANTLSWVFWQFLNVGRVSHSIFFKASKVLTPNWAFISSTSSNMFLSPTGLLKWQQIVAQARQRRGSGLYIE